MSNIYKSVEYRFTAWLYDIFDYWKDDNLEYIRELNLLDKIDLIQNTNKEFYNVCETLIDDNYVAIKVGVKTIWLNYEWEYIECQDKEEWFIEATENEIDKARDILNSRTVEIVARWYSQGDYDCYKIIVKNAKYKKEIEKKFNWLKQVFTIIEARVSLETRKVIDDNNTIYYSDWEDVDTEYSTEEFADIENMCRELVKRNSNPETEALKYLTEAHYIG